MMKLIIVESPGKAKRLAELLDRNEWQVIATRGHVRDLPENALGVDIANEFSLNYHTLPQQRSLIERLKKAAQTADALYIATDPDREGEAIAWHLLEEVRPNGKAVYRVAFNELTPQAVERAIDEPGQLDLPLVEAQQARRTVDRLVGYLVSPLACQALEDRVSAGRVQSVCLRLVVDREREIAAFSPTRYWTLEAKVQRQDSAATFNTGLAVVQRQRLTRFKQSFLEKLMEGLTSTSAVFWVGALKNAVRTRRPLPPFTTASLQQAANKAFGFTPERTMKVAQALYETGYITYMRTDSVSVSAEAQDSARSYIAETYGPNYVPAQPQLYQNKAPHTREAHEAIRATDVRRHPESSRNSDVVRLYELIRQRFIASQMSDAKYQLSGARILSGKVKGQPYPLEFHTYGRALLFDGFLKAYEEPLDDGEQRQTDIAFPSLVEGESLKLLRWEPKEHSTTAPDRYTEASLIKALEQRGIGRPSTYALMVKLLKDKHYVRLEKKRLVPTDIAARLCAFLIQHFPIVFNYQYTARLETELDRIAGGVSDRLRTLNTFWEKHFSAAFKAVATDVAGRLRTQTTTEIPPSKTKTCPRCGAAMVVRKGKYGSFLGCVNYPRCKGTAEPPIFAAIARQVAAQPQQEVANQE